MFFKSPVDIEDHVSGEEIWAIIDCNTSSRAQEIMNKRISRVCQEIQAEWNDWEREKRAPCIARIPWSLPRDIKANKPEFKWSAPRHGKNE